MQNDFRPDPIFTDFDEIKLLERQLMGLGKGIYENERLLAYNLPRKRRVITRGDLVLGFKTTEFEEPVTYKYDGKSVRIAIFGQTGTGKSVHMNSLVQQIVDKWGYHAFILDNKNDSMNFYRKLTDVVLAERLESVGIKPKGFDVKYFTPACSRLIIPFGKEFTIGILNFKNIRNHSIRLNIIKGLLEYGEEKGMPQSSSRILQGVCSKDPFPSTIPEFFEKLTTATKEYTKRIGLSKPPSILNVLFTNRATQRMVGDKYAVNWAKELSEHEMVVVKTNPLGGKKGDLALPMVATIISELFEDRFNYVEKLSASKTKGSKCWLDKPIVFQLDEAHNLANNDRYYSPTREILRIMSKIGRAPSISMVYATQVSKDLNKSLISQANVLITPRPTDENTLKLVAGRMRRYKGHLVDYRASVEILRSLKSPKKLPVQFLMVDKNGNAVKYYPNASQTALVEEELY